MSFSSFSQDQEKEKSKWHYQAELYLMFPTMSGQVQIGSLPAVEVDADAGTILDHLKMAAMVYLEANNGEWAITSDLLYMKLGQDVKESKIIKSGKVDMKETAWELAGLKRLTPWLEGGIGARLMVLGAGVDLQTETFLGTRDISDSDNKTWVDPIIVLRSNHVFKEKWLLNLRGDIGGFGIGSKFAWQAQAYGGYRFSELFQLTAGYRYIGIDYNKDGFVYDVNTYGPVLRLGFNF
jgi:hypothetical protein